MDIRQLQIAEAIYLHIVWTRSKVKAIRIILLRMYYMGYSDYVPSTIVLIEKISQLLNP